MTIEKRALSGTLAGTASFLVSGAQTLLLVPVLLANWGPGRYGAWLALQSLLSLVLTLDAGHQAYVGTEIAKLYVGDRNALRVVLASAIWTAIASGALELLIVVAISMTRLLPSALGLDAAFVAHEQLPIAFIILCVATSLPNSTVGMMARLWPPAGKYARYTTWGIVFRLIQAFAVACAAFLGARILGAAIACGVAAAGVLFLQFRDLRSQFPQLLPMHRGGRASLGARHYAEALVLTGSGTLAQLQQSGLNLIVTRALGVALLPAFTTARTLSGMFFLAPSIVCNPLAPDMTRFHVNREHDKLHATLVANWLVGGGVIQLGTIAALPFLSSIYEVWTRHSMPFNRGLFALLALSVTLRTFGSPLQVYMLAVNHLRALTAVNIAQSIVVLSVGAVASARLGLSGAGIAVLAGEVVGSCVVPMLFVAPELSGAWGARLWRDGAFASAPILVTGATLLAYAKGAPLSVLCIAGSLALMPLWTIQWLRLPPEVRVRVRGLLQSLTRRLPQRTA